MKFKNFFKIIDNFMRFEKDIDFKTIKKFLEYFYQNLSNQEKEKYFNDYMLLRNTKNFQLSIHETLKRNRINFLEEQLKRLKRCE